MTKFALTAFAAAAIAAPALAATPIDFTWEGHRIVGTVDHAGDTQIIKGKDHSTGRTFELHVRNGYVNGEIDGQLVSYRAPTRKLATTPTVG
jgi:hypothetical protein